MNRRGFIAAGAAALSGAPALAQGQPPILGFINDSGTNSGPAMIAFLRGLSREGFTSNQNALIIFQQADLYTEAPALAQNLVKRGAAVIVALSSPNMALAARDAAPAAPIVFAMAGDPVRLGLVESLEKPGGNITGVTFSTAAASEKLTGLLHALAPPAAPLGLLMNPANRGAEFWSADIRAGAARLSRSVALYEANSVAEINAAFTRAGAEKTGALAIHDDPRLQRFRDTIIAAAAREKIPVIYPDRDAAAAGGLMSFGDARAEQMRLLGEYAGRVLKGGKPAAIPVLQPAKFGMALNLKTAAAAGMEFPAAMLAAADETLR